MEHAMIDPSQSPLLVHEINDEAGIETALVTAFQEVGVEVAEKEPLYAFVPPDALNHLFSGVATPLALSVMLWGHPTVIEPDQVRIYEPSGSVGS